MSIEMGYSNDSFKAGADLSNDQYHFVKLVRSAGNDLFVNRLTTGISVAVGVLRNKPAASGRAAEVVTGGITKVEVGEAISAGDAVVADASGRAIKLDATGEIPVGLILQNASTGDVAPVKLGCVVKAANDSI
jgi:hypothetical protein